MEVQRVNNSDDGAANYNIFLDFNTFKSSAKREDQFLEMAEMFRSFLVLKLIPKKYKYTLNFVNEVIVTNNGKNETIAESLEGMLNVLSITKYNLGFETQKIAHHEAKGNKITLTTRPVSQTENNQWKEALNIFANAFKK